MNGEQGIPLIEASPIHLLHRAGQCAEDIFSRELSGNTLTPRQFAVMACLARNEGIRQTDLSALTGIDRSTLADIIRRMITKGLLTRRRAREDARAYSVRLSDKGRSALKKTTPAVEAADQRILSFLAPGERDAFLATLNSLVAAAERSNESRAKN